MDFTLPYSPTHKLTWLERFFKKNYYKKPYDRFMWWRSFTAKTKPLPANAPLLDRIENGDFDYAPFEFEAQIVEHQLNEKFQLSIRDQLKWVEETSLARARRKRLLADFEKEESKRLEALKKGLCKKFDITGKEYDNEISNSKGTILDFYFYLENKY